MAFETSRCCEESFVESVDLNIRSLMHRQWANHWEATLEDLAHQAQSVLELQFGHRKYVMNEDGERPKLFEELTERRQGKVQNALSWQLRTTQPRPRQARMAIRHQGHRQKWGIKSLQRLRVSMSRTAALTTVALIDEFATVAATRPQSAAIARRIPASSKSETRTMRPASGWNETIVGSHHTLPFTTFHPC